MHTRSLLLLASAAYAAVHEVDVGEGGQIFKPETITASIGDTVIFHLYPNHDVVQGAFDSPCTPSDGGIYSGPFSETDNGKKKFVVNVTSEDPVYVYCSVQKHCQNGMVGGMNLPSEGDTIEKYKEAAKGVDQSETPDSMSGGELLEDGQIASLTSTMGVASTSASGSGSPSETGATTTPSGSEAGATPSSTGAADVVAVGPATGVLAAALGLAAWFL